MLYVNLLIQKDAVDCAVTIITDQTGVYSSVNQGGYGVVNPLPADIKIIVSRTDPQGNVSRITLLPNAVGEVHQICNTWRYDTGVSVDPVPCGCTDTFVEPAVPAVIDGCYTYKTEVYRRDTSTFLSASEQTVLETCWTRRRIRKIALDLGTESCVGIDLKGRLCQWTLAWDKFESVINMPVIDCTTASYRLEQINLLLNGIS